MACFLFLTGQLLWHFYGKTNVDYSTTIEDIFFLRQGGDRIEQRCSSHSKPELIIGLYMRGGSLTKSLLTVCPHTLHIQLAHRDKMAQITAAKPPERKLLTGEFSQTGK